MNLKKEDQNVDTLILLRRGAKILIGGNMETKCGAEPEGKAIHILTYLGIHPIYSYQTQTFLCGYQEVHAERRLICLSPERS